MNPYCSMPTLALLAIQSATNPLVGPSFSVDHHQIPPGEFVTLSWHWSSAVRGYLTDAGDLNKAAMGSIRLQPKETTEYVLVLEDQNSNPAVLSERVVVLGEKGSAAEWPQDPFHALAIEKEYRLNPVSMIRVAEQVRRVLQDKLHFDVHDYREDPNRMIVVTAFAEKPELTNTDAHPDRRRKIAFRVELQPLAPPTQLKMDVSASIEWRNVIDSRWFPETAGPAYDAAIEALKNEAVGNR